MAKPHKSGLELGSLPQRAGRPPRGPRTSPLRTPAAPRPGSPSLLPELQRRWFDREVATLKRLAATERFAGDYVAAQGLERELDSFITRVSALTRREED